MATPTNAKSDGRNWFARLSTTWSDAIKRKDFGAMVDWFVLWFMGVGFFAIALAALAAKYGGDDGTGAMTVAAQDGVIGQIKVVPSDAIGLRVLALGLLMAGACGCTGWLFGLLFGVPRAMAQTTDWNVAAILAAAKTPGTASSRKAASKVNTNLEDISDWLTKTLVGVGLVELRTLPGFLGDLAHDANRYGFGWGDHGQLLALAIMLYFVPGGFWIGYVGTRTLLTGLFDYFNGGDWQDHVDQAAAADNLEIDAQNHIRPAKTAVMQADAAVLSKPMQTLDTEDEIVAWAAAQARLDNLQAARIALENVLGTNPDHLVAKRQLVKVYIALGRYPDAVDLSRDLPNLPPKLLATLYMAGGYDTALGIGDEILKNDPKLDASASFHIWYARALAQKYAVARTGKDATDPAAAAIEAQIKAELTKAINLDEEEARDALKFLANATKADAVNKEFVILKDLGWFNDLLDPAKVPPATPKTP